ncbi:MAG: hypothetical protein MMC33_005674 [Icmadophila ericetorum]|nr:hypothetical protein [Icmadophila ericetorum]
MNAQNNQQGSRLSDRVLRRLRYSEHAQSFRHNYLLTTLLLFFFGGALLLTSILAPNRLGGRHVTQGFVGFAIALIVLGALWLARILIDIRLEHLGYPAREDVDTQRSLASRGAPPAVLTSIELREILTGERNVNAERDVERGLSMASLPRQQLEYVLPEEIPLPMSPRQSEPIHSIGEGQTTVTHRRPSKLYLSPPLLMTARDCQTPVSKPSHLGAEVTVAPQIESDEKAPD